MVSCSRPHRMSASIRSVRRPARFFSSDQRVAEPAEFQIQLVFLWDCDAQVAEIDPEPDRRLARFREWLGTRNRADPDVDFLEVGPVDVWLDSHLWSVSA